MRKPDHNQLITLYSGQFGGPGYHGPGYHGSGYFARILRRYEANGCSADTVDYKQLLAEAAAERGIRPESMKRSIQRYVEKAWKRGFADAWAYYAGWREYTPPDAMTAIKLFCESFPVYLANFEDDWHE